MHPVAPNTPASTRASLQALCRGPLAGHSAELVVRLFDEVAAMFAGRHPGFQACAMPYHNFAHTCDVTVALTRLLGAYVARRRQPVLSGRDSELAVAAALLHDAGFLRRQGEPAGEDATLAATHVARGVALAAEVLPGFGVGAAEVGVVQLAIRCTDMEVAPVGFESAPPRDRCLGQLVGTADLLGQLAAPDYPERLGDLYRERVAAGQTGGLNEDGFRRLTRSFWNDVARPRLEGFLGGMYRLLPGDGGGGVDYLGAIHVNLDTIARRWPPR
jgi:hypothetical protein